MTEKVKTDKLKTLAEATSSELATAKKMCAGLAKREAGNFYYAFIFMPEEQRAGIEALYAFCRAGDDSVDNEKSQEPDLLESFRRRLDLCYNGQYLDDLTLALAWAIERFKFDRKHFDNLLLGIESDLFVKRYETFDELSLYCYRVASTVGLLCLRIFGCDTPESRLYAEKLGIGMQLTNILRDIREDYDRDRIYFPREDLVRFGINDGDIFAADYRENLRKLVLCEASRAENFFVEAESHLTEETNKPLFPARIMAAIYREILSKIVVLDCFDRRVELTNLIKLSIARRIFEEVFRNRSRNEV